MELNQDINNLFKTVVDGGYCIGCGACAALDNSPINIKFDSFKKLQAVINEDKGTEPMNTSVLSVCPFSNQIKNETQIGFELFGDGNRYNNKLGYVKSNYGAYVVEDDFRNNGSSGGMGTWILLELLKEKLVDYVVHVQPSTPDSDSKLFEYQITSDVDTIKYGAKSRYYPIEISQVVKQIRATPGKYVVVGLPCFIKAIRLLMAHDEILNSRIKFCVGLVCGHLKSANFANMWGWQVGIHPDNLKAINFREKLPGVGANNYGIAAEGLVEGKLVKRVSPPLKEMFGGDWGWGLFKYEACDYCDDVVAETADITIGDAWLEKYVNDSLGTNVVIVRNKILQRLVSHAYDEGRLHLEELSDEEVIESQQSGFNHRREGLSYRLHLKDADNKWRPLKRVPSENVVSPVIKKRLDLRLEFVKRSHLAFQQALSNNSFDVFKDELKPLIKEYKGLYPKTGLLLKIKLKLKKIFLSISKQ